jgi:hypothetical protein
VAFVRVWLRRFIGETLVVPRGPLPCGYPSSACVEGTSAGWTCNQSGVRPDGVRPGDIGHLAENLAAQSMTDLAERGSLGVRELQPPLQLGLQDAIFGGQIFNPRQQLLVHHPRDEGQNARPIHSSSTPADSQLLAQKIVASGTRRGYAENGQLTVFSTVLIF